MCKMAMGMRMARLFMLVIGFCMLFFPGLPSAAEMEGPEVPGLDPEKVQVIKALSEIKIAEGAYAEHIHFK